MKFNVWLVIVVLLFVNSCSSGSEHTSAGNEIEIPQGNEFTDASLIAVPAALSSASRAYIFDYSMVAVTGAETAARAMLFEPDLEQPDSGYPLVVWAHGTTGIANACAPSASFARFANTIAINALLAAGYAVLAPDYEGFGTPSIHPYFIRASHANAVLSAVPSAHRIEGTLLSDNWAIVGHSQGGHVALVTARAEQLRDYPLQAVVALAPGTDLIALSDTVFDTIDQEVAAGDIASARQRLYYLNVYGAYIGHAISLLNPNFNPASLFADTIRPMIDLAKDEQVCGEFAEMVFSSLDQHLEFGGSLAEFGGIKRNWHDDPIITAIMEEEEMGDEVQVPPLLIVQGDADLQVPVAATTAFVDRQRGLGADVNYEIIGGGSHSGVARAEFQRTLNWLEIHFPP